LTLPAEYRKCSLASKGKNVTRQHSGKVRAVFKCRKEVGNKPIHKEQYRGAAKKNSAKANKKVPYSLSALL